jgi:hypothetical protein
MAVLDIYWLDLIGLGIALVCVNGGITGKFYTHRRRGGKRLLAQVDSFWIRVVFLSAGLAMFVLVLRDSLQKLSNVGLR